MKKVIPAGFIIALMLFSLCVDENESSDTLTTITAEANKDHGTTPTTAVDAGTERCVSFSCDGSLETREESENVNIAYCDGRETARIVCQASEGVNTNTGKSMNEYSMCCTSSGPERPTCDRCMDGTACGSRTGRMKCSCEDWNGDGRYESCDLWPAGCEGCADGTLCGEMNDKKEICKCEGIASPVAGESEYESCELVQTCDMCIDGTMCGGTNEKGDTCECYPSTGPHETCELHIQMTCEEACQEIGYMEGYCGEWVLNADSTVSECNTGEYPLYKSGLQDVYLKECIDAEGSEETRRTVCCCRGEPENNETCPTIQWPAEPMDCIEEPGFLKNPNTGECCWYTATCYGPEGWQEYRTKEECVSA